MKKQRLFESKTKRLVDIFVSIMGIIVFLPIWIIIALLIKITSPGPILFTQDRPGYHKKIFKVYKFRTMYPGSEKMVKGKEVMKDDSRVTGFGKFLRRSKLDEIPQLWNVLKGDMSLVGPRPERPELAKVITKNIPEFTYRLKVKAGLTGYAQIYGRYCTTSYDKLKLDLTYLELPERYRLDVYYVEHFSLKLDLEILLRTIGVVFLGEEKYKNIPLIKIAGQKK